MALLVFSGGSYASAIWFQGDDGGQDGMAAAHIQVVQEEKRTLHGCRDPCYLHFGRKGFKYI